MENAGIAQLKLLRSGGDLSDRILVKFSTRDKSALRGRHYIHEEGTPIRICFSGMVNLLKCIAFIITVLITQIIWKCC